VKPQNAQLSKTHNAQYEKVGDRAILGVKFTKIYFNGKNPAKLKAQPKMTHNF